jgi:small subunit ribosomal protein S8
MNCTDPIAEMLTSIRNGSTARHDSVSVSLSKMKLALAQILREEGFILNYEVTGDKQKVIKINLRYDKRKKPVLSGLKRISKSGARVYSPGQKIPRIYGGIGVAVLSTSKGIMTGERARKDNIGGEVLCYLW